jgi:hypothetical protein
VKKSQRRVQNASQKPEVKTVANKYTARKMFDEGVKALIYLHRR